MLILISSFAALFVSRRGPIFLAEFDMKKKEWSLRDWDILKVQQGDIIILRLKQKVEQDLLNLMSVALNDYAAKAGVHMLIVPQDTEVMVARGEEDVRHQN
jgi:hypothetical protein